MMLPHYAKTIISRILNLMVGLIVIYVLFLYLT